MPNIFLTSDQHFGHANVLAYCNRPFKTVEEMNAALIVNYQLAVQPEDTVYFLGDVFFGSKEFARLIASQLWGRKVLVLGNHDRWSKGFYRSLGFDDVVSSLEIELQGQTVLLAHHPNVEADRYQLCGHVHEKWQRQGKVLNVGVDQHDFAPISGARVADLLLAEDGMMPPP
jgi:calcineurin-like phosphoesterase family protein